MYAADVALLDLPLHGGGVFVLLGLLDLSVNPVDLHRPFTYVDPRD